MIMPLEIMGTYKNANFFVVSPDSYRDQNPNFDKLNTSHLQ